MLLKEVLKLNIIKVAHQERITARGILLSLGFAALTAVCAQLAIRLPWTPVPVTLQVFAVLLTGLMLGRKLGALSQVQYLAAGLAGAPVFAGFTGGPAALLGPSGGYLPGFVLGAYAAGFVWEKARKRSMSEAIIAGITGTAVIYLCGVSWLSVYLGEISWIPGAATFIGADAVKIAAASVIAAGRPELLERVRSRWK